MKIACGNGIFAYPPMFSYGQRSKCADLLNSYPDSCNLTTIPNKDSIDFV